MVRNGRTVIFTILTFEIYWQFHFFTCTGAPFCLPTTTQKDTTHLSENLSADTMVGYQRSVTHTKNSLNNKFFENLYQQCPFRFTHLILPHSSWNAEERLMSPETIHLNHHQLKCNSIACIYLYFLSLGCFCCTTAWPRTVLSTTNIASLTCCSEFCP